MIGLGAATAAIAGVNAGTGLMNTYMQWQNLQYQKHVQSQIFGREDSSIRRRVRDLKAAGLSPVLAAGQGAGTGGVVKTNAPQVDLRAGELLAMMKMKQDIEVTEEQKKLIQAQARNANASADLTSWDLSRYVASKLPSNAAGWAKEVAEIFQLLQGKIGPAFTSPTQKEKDDYHKNKADDLRNDMPDYIKKRAGL